jgi:CubicO group peptidase (beta-lactamase class C family)
MSILEARRCPGGLGIPDAEARPEMTAKPRILGFTRILSAWLLFSLIGPGGLLARQTRRYENISAGFESEILKTMARGNIPSASAVLVKDGRIIWAGAYGYSNVRARTPAFTETVYLIGSIFKTMSACALLREIEKGQVQLDDPVSLHLGDLKVQGDSPTNPVTFRHLLTHTSGLPADFGPCPVWSDRAPLPLRTYLERSLRLQVPPLTKVVYSNMAYTLIAYLVEKLSGTPYRTYIQQNIFDPLEMADTAFEPRPEMVERLAIPYFFEAKSQRYVPVGWTKANVWPAGIVYGTVIDLGRWLIANLNHGVYKGYRLISEKTFNEVMRRQYDQFAGPIHEGWLNETSGYGLTWWVSDRGGERVFAHSGSVTGYTAFLVGNLDRKTGFAILTNGNRAHQPLFDLALKALDYLAGKTQSVPAAEDH